MLVYIKTYIYLQGLALVGMLSILNTWPGSLDSNILEQFIIQRVKKSVIGSVNVRSSITNIFRFRCSFFFKVPRPGDSEVTFAVFESSC